MAVPESAELVAVARLLLATSPVPPSHSQLRRAASTAYYALFHHLAEAAALRFMGPGRQDAGGYLSIYRSFEHGNMRQACSALTSPVLSPRTARQLGRATISREVRAVARDFNLLQGQRQFADYDPQITFTRDDVLALVASAELAIAAFDRAAPDEQADVLAFLMVKPRP